MPDTCERKSMIQTSKKLSKSIEHSDGEYTAGLDGQAKMCLVTREHALAKRFTELIHGIRVLHNLTDAVREADCSVYIIDIKIPDIEIWPAPLLRRRQAPSVVWIFLASDIEDINRLRLPLPGYFRVFNREPSRLDSVKSFIQDCLNPELGRTISRVDYMEEDRSFIVQMGNRKSYLLRMDDLPESDSSSLTRIEPAKGGRSFRVEQESGNWFEVPWDDVLYHCEPDYEYFKGRRSPAAGGDDLAVRTGQKIRRFRTSKGLTVEELARRAAMKRPNLSRLEHGKHQPSLDTLERIAAALDVPVAELVAR